MARRRWLVAVALLGVLAAACPTPTGGEETEDEEEPGDDSQGSGDGEPAAALPQVEAAPATGTFNRLSGDCSEFTDTFTYTIDGDRATITIRQPSTGQSVSGPIDPQTAIARASGEFERYLLLVPVTDMVVVGGYVHDPAGGCEGEMTVRFDFETGLCAQGGVEDEACSFSTPPPDDPECPFDSPASCEEWTAFYNEQLCEAAGTCPE